MPATCGSCRGGTIATSPTSIDHAEAVLRACDIEPRPADRMLESYLRRHPEISSRERRMLADIVFGVMRWRLRLDGMCRAAGVGTPTHRHRAVAYARWRGISETDADDILGLSFDPHIGGGRSFPGGDASYLSYPDFLYRRIIRERGVSQGMRMMLKLNEPAATVIRANACLASREELAERLGREGIASRPTRYSPFGLVLDARAQLSSLGSFREGWFEVHDEASQLASLFTGVRSGDTVLDACAGAGGKSLAMAMLMEDRGRIVATDRDARRLDRLRKRAARAQAGCIEICTFDALARDMGLRGMCDVVLIDAPCSGTGTLRRSPDIKWRIDEPMIAAYASGQRALIEEYAPWLKPGGRLVYLTCSILAEENEEVVAWVQRRGLLRRLARRETGLPHADGWSDLVAEDGTFDTMRLTDAAMDGFFGSQFGMNQNRIDNPEVVIHKRFLK